MIYILEHRYTMFKDVFVYTGHPFSKLLRAFYIGLLEITVFPNRLEGGSETIHHEDKSGNKCIEMIRYASPSTWACSGKVGHSVLI